MEHSTASRAGRMRWGAACLAIASVLFAVFPLLHPFPVRSDVDATAWAQGVTSASWVAAHLINIASFVTLILGLLGLYGYLATSRVERQAFVALLISITGSGLILPTAGVETFAQPAIGSFFLQTGVEATPVSEALYTGGPGLAVVLLGLLLLDIGAVLFALAIRRSGILPPWAGIPFALGLVLFFPVAPPVVRIAGGLLTAVGGLSIAWGISRGSGGRLPASHGVR